MLTRFMSRFARSAAAVSLLLFGMPAAAMTEMEDHDLSESAAYGLLWTDKITGTELAGNNVYSQPFTFYRMGIDGQLALNINIAKAQLGCGGVNDLLNARAGCDIDVDYLTMMGRTNLTVGNPLSAMKLERPYIELAVKNDGTANREIVGLKIGAQTADGAMVTGRRYAANGANQENTMDWTQFPFDAQYWDDEPVRVAGTNCNTGVDYGNGVVGCHSGINSISGFLGTEMSLSMYVRARACAFICLPVEVWGCIGRTTLGADQCANTKAAAFFLDLAGTRLQYLGLRNAWLNMNDNALLDLLGGDAYASMNADLRLLHSVVFKNTGDFFISFQREPVAYPRFSKMTPKAEFAAVDPNYLTNTGPDEMFMDGCATTRWDTARCDSAYSVPANTGWWLNAPTVKLLNIVNNDVALGDLSLARALELLDSPGLLLSNPEFNLTPAKNCYGATRFC